MDEKITKTEKAINKLNILSHQTLSCPLSPLQKFQSLSLSIFVRVTNKKFAKKEKFTNVQNNTYPIKDRRVRSQENLYHESLRDIIKDNVKDSQPQLTRHGSSILPKSKKDLLRRSYSFGSNFRNEIEKSLPMNFSIKELKDENYTNFRRKFEVESDELFKELKKEIRSDKLKEEKLKEEINESQVEMQLNAEKLKGKELKKEIEKLKEKIKNDEQKVEKLKKEIESNK